MIFNGEGEGLKAPFIEYGASDDYKGLSRGLFGSLRRLDELEAEKCFVRCPDETDEDNLAVLNRLLRAAGFKIINN